MWISPNWLWLTNQIWFSTNIKNGLEILIFKYQPMQQWRDVVGGEGLPCLDWHCGSHLITSAFQPSNIKPSWSNEYLILFRFDTSSESPYIRFLVLVIQVWFIRLQKIYLNVNFWVRLISFIWNSLNKSIWGSLKFQMQPNHLIWLNFIFQMLLGGSLSDGNILGTWLFWYWLSCLSYCTRGITVVCTRIDRCRSF